MALYGRPPCLISKPLPRRLTQKTYLCKIPPAPPTTLMMTVGGISEKPGVVDGHIAIRDYLSLTISFDHDIIDGAPAARFTQRLKDLIESGYGLPDSTLKSEQAGAEAASMQQVEATHTALP